MVARNLMYIENKINNILTSVIKINNFNVERIFTDVTLFYRMFDENAL